MKKSLINNIFIKNMLLCSMRKRLVIGWVFFCDNLEGFVKKDIQMPSTGSAT